MRTISFVIVILLAFTSGVSAKVEVLIFSTVQHETRYKKMVDELRCLVCQNQNIAASNADLAKDLRQQVYSRIENGETDEQIIAYMVARYGDFVLYKPPLNATTAFLWIGPFALLGLGIVVMVRLIRSRRTHVAIPQASLERARNLLKDNNETP
ncbi:MAG: cytochrome c-type biogenesis protein CcmH [Methylococcaceae bacterium]|nr:cytochrome c-type biogenesis protein CcmH [Methylococcaceae bacterium]